MNLQYRQANGVLNALSKYIPKLSPADYTTIWRRERQLCVEIPDHAFSGMAAIDSTGIKVTNRGEWMREKWKIHRGWLKVHVAVDIETGGLVSMEITDERTGDDKVAPVLLQRPDITKVFADGAYDTYELFSFFDKKGIAPVVRIRKNAVEGGLNPRSREVRKRKRMGGDTWKKQYGYGRRWAVEGFFSGAKRAFGETVRATSADGMMREAAMKMIAYAMIRSL